MKRFGGPAALAALLSFNGGFVDAAGFLGLQGLFISHVTGNFVTLGAALVLGSHGIVGKILALPEFVLAVALARIAGDRLRSHDLPVRRPLLLAEAALLLAFFALAMAFGPFEDPDTPAALVTSFAGIAAMAVQNAVQRVHLADLPPTTIMTGNTTQATMDLVDLLSRKPEHAAQTRARFIRIALGIAWFASGCASAAFLYWLAGFWCLALAVVVAIAAALMHTDPAPKT